MGNTSQGQEKGACHGAQQPSHGEHSLGLHMPGLESLKKKNGCCCTCLKVLYVLLGIIIILLAIATIAVTITTAIATKMYSSEVSGRMAAMIILALTAGVALSVSTYGLVAVFSKKNSPVHAVSVGLVIVAVIQAVICGVSVRVTQDDELELTRSLTESFQYYLQDQPRHIGIWATTQSDLACCGVHSAEDYRTPRLPAIFAPDVPVSCCPGYDSDRSDLVQEREREICKGRREYYDIGCQGPVLEVFRDTSAMVLAVTISLIVFEVATILLGAILTHKKKKKIQETEGKP